MQVILTFAVERGEDDDSAWAIWSGMDAMYTGLLDHKNPSEFEFCDTSAARPKHANVRFASQEVNKMA